MAGPGTAAAVAVRDALSRIGRFAPASAPSALPYALVADRLGALTAGPEVDQALDVALGRVAGTEAAPPAEADGSDHHRRTTDLTRSLRTPIDPGPVPGRSRRLPPPSATTLAPGATADVPAARHVRTSTRSSPQMGGRKGVENAETGRVRVGPPLVVRRDPAVAATLRTLTSQTPAQHATPGEPGSPDPVAAARPSPPAPPFGSLGAAPATPAGHPATTDVGSRGQVAAASRLQRSAAAEPASTQPAPAARGPNAVPPVGLAGLVAWWEGDRPPALVADPGPWRTDEPLSGLAADPLALFRDALEQVLLEEAMADGLEVSDGPA